MNKKEKKTFDKGLYKGASVSVKALDTIIIAGLLILASIIVLSALQA